MQAWILWASKLRVQCGRSRKLARALAAAAAVACLGLATSARAGFSTIQTPLSGNMTQPALLDHIYGGTFTLEDGVDYTNGTITAVRISDTLPNTSSLSYDNPGPTATDQIWQDNTFQATVEYSSAEYPSTPFGYIPGSSGGTFTPLFTVSGSGYAVTGSGSFSPASGTFRVAAVNHFGDLSSLPSDNTDSQDHMVTYEIDGTGGTGDTYLALFTDYGNSGTDAYFDYQNLVVQLQTNSSNVPEPGSLMIIGGVALGLLKRIPRRVR